MGASCNSQQQPRAAPEPFHERATRPSGGSVLAGRCSRGVRRGLTRPGLPCQDSIVRRICPRLVALPCTSREPLVKHAAVRPPPPAGHPPNATGPPERPSPTGPFFTSERWVGRRRMVPGLPERAEVCARFVDLDRSSMWRARFPCRSDPGTFDQRPGSRPAVGRTGFYPVARHPCH
jgi:hypothetical protein